LGVRFIAALGVIKAVGMVWHKVIIKMPVCAEVLHRKEKK